MISLGFISCGPPSPWASYVKREGDLTRKALQKLGAGDGHQSQVRIGLIADPQVLPAYLYKVLASLDKHEDLDFYIILGDLTDRSLQREFEWVAEAIDKAHRPVLTVVGNHDGLLFGESIYKELFGALNYSFSYSGIKFVLWNNNPYEWGYPDFDWLESEVSDFDRIVVASHQPPGKIERFEDANDRMNEVLEREEVIASFHGHTHKFSLDFIGNKPIYTVGRVTDIQYGIATIANDSVTIEKCRRGECYVLEQ